MTPQQEAHLQGIKDQFAREVDAKYRGGVREHGGNVWEMSDLKLVEEGMQEAVDQYVYLSTLRDKMLGALPA